MGLGKSFDFSLVGVVLGQTTHLGVVHFQKKKFVILSLPLKNQLFQDVRVVLDSNYYAQTLIEQTLES